MPNVFPAPKPPPPLPSMIPLAALAPAPTHLFLLSPNHNARPAWVDAIRCVVLHATADGGNERAAEAWLRNPASGVSAHLHVRRDGTVVRLVPDRLRAWHAGRSAWRAWTNANDISLGWEIANRNDGREAYTHAQHIAVAALAAHYLRQGIPLEGFVGHAEIALPRGRKRDPLGWDWTPFRGDVALIGTLLPGGATAAFGGNS